MSNNFKILSFVCFLSSLITLSGCAHDYYEVESIYQLNELVEVKSEITETDAYKKLIPKVKKIAVRAPEQCANETQSASRGLGVAGSNAVVLRSLCGQEMSQIERSLVQLGYRVISWKVVQSKTRAQSKPAIEVAKSLGANLLLQINTLERTAIRPGIDARWDRKYYTTDSGNHREEPVSLDKIISDQIEVWAKQSERNSMGAARLSASLNATAVSTKTGEAIWFYDWTVSQDVDDRVASISSFSACKSNRCKPWNLAEINSQNTSSSGSSDAVRTSIHSDEDRAIQDKLVKQIINDMIKNLKP